MEERLGLQQALQGSWRPKLRITLPLHNTCPCCQNFKKGLKNTILGLDISINSGSTVSLAAGRVDLKPFPRVNTALWGKQAHTDFHSERLVFHISSIPQGPSCRSAL